MPLALAGKAVAHTEPSQKTCQVQPYQQAFGGKAGITCTAAAEAWLLFSLFHHSEGGFLHQLKPATMHLVKNTLLMGAAVLCASLAQAQKKDSLPPTLDEVTITANRIEQKQSQTGKVVAVINREMLARNGGKTVAQLLNEQAGITVNGALNNPGTNQNIFMRGANGGRTLILLDGIPVYDPSFINNDFDMNLLSTNDVERIEICRGAQSTVYGSDAIAGVINIITTKNNNRPANLKAGLAGGNYGSYQAHAQAYGTAGKLQYAARYARRHTDGFGSAYDSTGAKDFDRDRYTGNMANLRLQYALSGAWSLKAFVQHNSYKTDFDASGFTDEKDFTQQNRNLVGGGGFRMQQKGWSLSGNYQYSQNHREFLNDSGYVAGFTKYESNNYHGRSQFAELFAKVALGSRLSLVAGADYRYALMNQSYLAISSFGPYESNFRDTSVRLAAAYASLLYGDPLARLHLELGARYNHHSQYGNNTTFTFNPSYRLGSKWRLFGSIASGFKAPSLYQLYSSYGNIALEPEKAITYEAGVQQQGKNTAHRVVFFSRNLNNGLDFNYNTYQYFNLIEQQVSGLEYEGRWSPAKQVTLTGNYSWLYSRETTQSRISFTDTTYSYLLRRPAHAATLTVGYAPSSKLNASLTGKYVSERYDVGGYKAGDVPLDAYLVLSAYAEFRFSRALKVYADAQNLLNTKFFDIRGYNSIPLLIMGGISIEL